MTKFIVCSLNQVPLFENEVTHVISINDPDRYAVFKNIPESNILRLNFLDIGAGRYASLGLYHNGPKITHIRDICEFALKLPNSANCMVHCWAGVSRSPAACLISMFLCGVEFEDLMPSLQMAIKSTKYPTPNYTMMKLADELLDTNNMFSKIAIKYDDICRAQSE